MKGITKKQLTESEKKRIELVGYFSGNIDFNTNQNENVITEFIEKLDLLLQAERERCAKKAGKFKVSKVKPISHEEQIRFGWLNKKIGYIMKAIRED